MIICNFNTIDSTNKYAKTLINNNCDIPDRFAIFSYEQTEGVGKPGNKWISSFGNMHLSLGLKKENNLQSLQFLNFLCPLVLKKILTNNYNVDGSIIKFKWVNDVFVDNAKISGILIENEKNYAVIGIGLNVIFAPKVDDYNTAFLQKYVTKVLDPLIIAQEIVDEIINSLDISQDKILKSWQESALYLQQEIVCKQGNNEYYGTFLGINNKGNLKLKLSNGVIKIFLSGEIRCL